MEKEQDYETRKVRGVGQENGDEWTTREDEEVWDGENK